MTPETAPESAAGKGAPQPLPGNAPLLLGQHPGTAWLVRSGRVEIFSVQPPGAEGGPTPGRRRHLAGVAQGALFTWLPSRTGLGFLAVGGPDTAAQRLSLAELPAILEARAGVPLLDGWLAALGRSQGGAVPSRPDVVLAPGETLLAAGQTAVPGTGTVWVSLLEGDAQVEGGEPPAALPAGPFPLPPGTWLHSPGGCHLGVETTEAVWGKASLGSGLEAFLGVLADWEQARRQRLARAEAERSQRLADFEQALSERALQELAGVLQGEERTPPVPGQEPLLAACRLVGQAQGIDIRPPPHRLGDDPGRDLLRDILQASRVRARQVRLAGEWWRQDAGPLLGFRRQDGGPVALLPGGRAAYVLVDPSSGRRCRVDRDLAGELSGEAFCFYRPLPERPLGAGEVAAYALRGSRGDVLRLILAGLLSTGLSLLTPAALGWMVHSLVPEAEGGRLLGLFALLVVAALAAALFLVARSLALLRLGTRAYTALQTALWDRLVSLPVPFFRRFSAGDLAYRALAPTWVRMMVDDSVLMTLLASFLALANFALLFHYEPDLAWLALALTLGAAGVVALGAFLQLRYQRRMAALQGGISGLVLQLITGIAKLRVAGAELRAFEAWARAFAEQRRVTLQARRMSNRMTVFFAGWTVLSSLTFYWAAAGPERNASTFLAFYLAWMQFSAAVLAGLAGLSVLLAACPQLERLKPILETPPEALERRADPGSLSGAVEVQGVCFRYRADGPLVLQDVSLRANPGEFVAIVGASGAGKSTLVRLLLGFEEPESGSVFYDGQNLSGLDLRAVRRQIGVVLQDGRLMAGSILQNILGSYLGTLEDAWEAARLAGIADDIRQFPMGMHTFIMEGGSMISGGQRQRLLIARAVVARPRILLLDEATSALDNRVQAEVSEALAGLRATRLVVAHRLSTVTRADRIYVLEAGRVVQVGGFQELLEQPGPFRDLASRQLL